MPMQDSDNEDPGTCYVAFNYGEFASKVFGSSITCVNATVASPVVARLKTPEGRALFQKEIVVRVKDITSIEGKLDNLLRKD